MSNDNRIIDQKWLNDLLQESFNLIFGRLEKNMSESGINISKEKIITVKLNDKDGCLPIFVNGNSLDKILKNVDRDILRCAIFMNDKGESNRIIIDSISYIK